MLNKKSILGHYKLLEELQDAQYKNLKNLEYSEIKDTERLISYIRALNNQRLTLKYILCDGKYFFEAEDELLQLEKDLNNLFKRSDK